eukprot:scaffold139192_cov139-Phaeocystis_antarctica.AAC.1
MERVVEFALSLQYLGSIRIVASDVEPCVRLSLPLVVVSKQLAPPSGLRQGAHWTLATARGFAWTRGAERLRRQDTDAHLAHWARDRFYGPSLAVEARCAWLALFRTAQVRCI